MSPTFTRRGFAAATGAALVAVFSPRVIAAAGDGHRFLTEIAKIEGRLQGRLGVAVTDAESGLSWSHRGEERFPLCSTFKALAAAAVLAKVDAGQDDLRRRVTFTPQDLIPYSPVTESQTGGDGMTLAALCDAAVTRSDNTAGNLLLKAIGGPTGLTAFARRIGDGATRLDRWEPELNEATPGDPRDTTTPLGMAAGLNRLTFGDGLSEQSRAHFIDWLVGNKTGDARLRAGAPKGWRIGEKTGTGRHGAAHDVGAVWPTDRAPLVVAVYIAETKAPLELRNRAIADVAAALPLLPRP